MNREYAGRQLRGAFANRHGHGVGADEQGGKEHSSADGEDEDFHAAESVDEIEFERLLTLAFSWEREWRGTCRRWRGRLPAYARGIGRG